MDELKPCPYTDEEVSQKLRKWKGHCQIPGLDELILWAADIIDRRPAPENKPLTLCGENENFVQTKFGYCFFTLESHPMIYNLYVHPQYRHNGHSRALLELAISEIRKSSYKEEIYIQAEPRENSVGLKDLIEYYKRMGLVIYETHKPKQEEK